MKPFISVYIPVYNGEKHIKECLDSVLGQTFQDFEVVICDDRSSDGTVDIIKEYARRDPRIIFSQNEVNFGCVLNHKRCISYTRGEWIKPINHDDLLSPTCLEKMASKTSRNIPIMACRRDFILAEDVSATIRAALLKFTHVDDFFPNKTEISAQEISCAAIDHFSENFIGEPVVMMIKRDALNRFDSYNPNMSIIADLEYWLRVSSNTGMVYIPEVLASFRIHNDSITARLINNKQHLRSRFDQLILLHEFALSPYYAHLRKVVLARNPGIDLIDWLSQRLRKAHKEFLSGSKEGVKDNRREWDALMANYPMLGELFRSCNIFRKIGSIHKKDLKQVILNRIRNKRRIK